MDDIEHRVLYSFQKKSVALIVGRNPIYSTLTARKNNDDGRQP